ncbi:MAG: HAMP domain-containing histidine kinase, partial [Gemmatimonadetes bacterium]|nr:HAMP domain-containing histidine kinase [Gemmatimonadota bacterium]
LGPHVVQRLLEARGLADRWHGRVQTDDAGPRDEAAGRVPRERQLFAQVMTAVAALDSTIVQETLSVRTEIVAAESTGLRITLGLGLLALAAGIAVLALQARVRNSAEEAERRRVVAAEALTESAQVAEARARLLRGITHDVKNPLGAAKGYAELLSMGIKAPLDPAQIPLVEGIGRSIDTALAIIADLLDLSRVDSVGISVKRVETDLNDIVREAMEDHRAAAESAGHRMDAELAGGPVLAYTDPGRVRQVLDNLLSNAIKYTPPPGTITVRAGSYDGARPPAPGAWSTIIVCDTGPGIPVEQREAVVDEFTRIDEGSAKGHGLGLAIARGLARQLGGDLTIAGSGPGATFVLWIAQRDQPAVHDNRRAGQATPGSAAGGDSA